MSDRSVIGKIGCFADKGAEVPPVTPRGRVSRAVAGLLFLAGAVVAIAWPLPVGILVWPVAAIAAWFGVSHLVAAVTRYQGCPEIGAIASLVLSRPVATNCDIWQRIDRVTGADRQGVAADREGARACC